MLNICLFSARLPSTTKMRVVILLIAVTIAAANTIDIVPEILEAATPADVLMYLYDVVLTSHMTTAVNEQGVPLISPKNCDGNMPFLLNGKCAPTTTTVSPEAVKNVYSYEFDYDQD